MTFEEYNQLSYDYEHCAGTHCEKASQCLRYTAYTMLESGGGGTVYDVEPESGNGCTAVVRTMNRSERNVLRGASLAFTTMCGRLT